MVRESGQVTISIHREVLKDALPDLGALFPAQWAETGDNSIEFNPNWDLYFAIEQNHRLLFAVIREDGKAIGYGVGALYAHPNSKDLLVGSVPTYFVQQRANRSLLLRSLFHFMAKEAVSRGACEVNIETDYSNSAGRILEAMEFKPFKVGYKLKIAERMRKAG